MSSLEPPKQRPTTFSLPLPLDVPTILAHPKVAPKKTDDEIYSGIVRTISDNALKSIIGNPIR